jgi:hypothetical protein
VDVVGHHVGRVFGEPCLRSAAFAAVEIPLIDRESCAGIPIEGRVVDAEDSRGVRVAEQGLITAQPGELHADDDGVG